MAYFEHTRQYVLATKRRFLKLFFSISVIFLILFLPYQYNIYICVYVCVILNIIYIYLYRYIIQIYIIHCIKLRQWRALARVYVEVVTRQRFVLVTNAFAKMPIYTRLTAMTTVFHFLRASAQYTIAVYMKIKIFPSACVL